MKHTRQTVVENVKIVRDEYECDTCGQKFTEYYMCIAHERKHVALKYKDRIEGGCFIWLLTEEEGKEFARCWDFGFQAEYIENFSPGWYHFDTYSTDENDVMTFIDANTFIIQEMGEIEERQRIIDIAKTLQPRTP